MVKIEGLRRERQRDRERETERQRERDRERPRIMLCGEGPVYTQVCDKVYVNQSPNKLVGIEFP